MARRGRPPHPDVLTPREWDVLTLVRDGLTNQQIAERLGISMDAAKYHVSEILSKLQLSTREQAAAWQPEASQRPVLRPAWASALARWWPALAWAGSAAVAAGLGVLVYGLVKSSSSDNGQAEATGSATATFAAGASPTTGPMPDAISVSVGVGTDFPQDFAFIMENGCFNCDGGITSLTRVYKSGDGYVTDTLFTPDKVGQGAITVQTDKGPEQRTAQITGYAARPDGTNIVIGTSYDYALGGSRGVTKLFQSQDGGVTWQPYGELQAGEFLTGDIGGGGVLVGRYPFDSTPITGNETPSVSPPDYFYFPSNQPIQQPVGATSSWSPVISADGTLTWYTDDGRVLDQTGTEIASVPGSVAGHGEAARTADRTWAWLPQNGGDYYLDQITADEKLTTYHVPGLATLGPDIGKGSLLVTIDLTSPTSASPGALSTTLYPAVLDLTSHTLQPILHPFADAGYAPGRNSVATLMGGPFAKVTGTGSCLNIRSQPVESAPIVECAADAVLLYDSLTGDKLVAATPIAGWREVNAPDGVHGYASSDFLTLVH